MQFDLSSNYFDLFDLPKQFDIDNNALQNRYRELQRNVHPDKFAAAEAAEKRWSVQAAALINSAHETLSKPLMRAVYLLKMEGVDLDMETDTQMAPEFLMTQMELREGLESIESSGDPFAAADRARSEIRESVGSISASFAANYGSGDFEAACERAREWQFLDKLLREVADIESRLDENV